MTNLHGVPPSPHTGDNAPQGLDRLEEIEDERPRVLLHMPVDVRSISLVLLATLASIFTLRWAPKFLSL